MAKDEYEVLKEQNREYFNIYKYLFGEDPKVMLVPINGDNPGFQQICNVLMKDIFNNRYGTGDKYDPYSVLINTTMPSNIGQLAELLYNGGLPYNIVDIDDFLHVDDKDGPFPQGLTSITSFGIPGTIKKMITTRFLWIDKLYATPQRSNEVVKAILTTMLKNYLIHVKSPLGVRLSVDVPMVWNEEDKHMWCNPPVLQMAHKKIDNHTAMFNMIRSQSSKDPINKWENEHNPLDLQVISFTPSDAFSLPDSAVNLLADSYQFFDKQYCRSRKMKAQKFQSIQEARNFLYSEFMRKNHTTLFFLKDHQPVGIAEYVAKPNNPVHIAKLYVYKEHRGKGYGSWMLKNILSETYNLPECLPYQTLRVFGSQEKKLLPFYFKYGFMMGSIETEWILESEDIRELANQINA